jgi:hypothetical protein
LSMKAEFTVFVILASIASPSTQAEDAGIED